LQGYAIFCGKMCECDECLSDDKRYVCVASLAIQRDQFLREKADEQERYKKALETQVHTRNGLIP